MFFIASSRNDPRRGLHACWPAMIEKAELNVACVEGERLNGQFSHQF